VTLPR